MSTQSLGGALYFLTFVDDKSHYTWVYVLKHKSEVLQKLKEWKALVETSSGYRLKKLRTDNGGEYCSDEFEQFCKGEGVHHELMVPKTPEQNGVAERINHTLVKAVRSMLADSKLPKRFWAKALSTAVYTRNRSPTKAVNGMTPFEAWTGEKPNVDIYVPLDALPMHMLLKTREKSWIQKHEGVSFSDMAAEPKVIVSMMQVAAGLYTVEMFHSMRAQEVLRLRRRVSRIKSHR